MNKRLDYIDVVKGIGITLVIMGHTFEVPQTIYNVIYSFHMPLFYVVSGYLYNVERYQKMALKDIVKKRAKDYLLPYYFFAFVNLGLVIAWAYFMSRNPLSEEQVRHYIKGIIYCRAHMLHMPNCTPIWFLMSLFFTSVLFEVILRQFPKRCGIVALCSMGIGYVLSVLLDEPLPLKLDTVFMAMFFMYIGHCIRKYDLLRLPVTIAFIGVMGLFLGTKNTVGMNENEYGNISFFLISSISVSYSLMLICKKSILSKVKVLQLLGRHSLLIVGFNYFIRDVAVEIYYLIPIIKEQQITWLPSFLIALLMAVLGVWVWDKWNNKKCSCNIKDSTQL